MPYQLEVHYSTGNTFGTHEETRVIDEIIFEDLESAKEALQFISQHKKLNEQFSRERDTKKREVIKLDIESKPWSVKSSFDGSFEYVLNVRTAKDKTDLTEIYAFWMGYFETLHEVRIIDAYADELSIKF